MNYTLSVILSFSISIAAIIGLVRFNSINAVYYPFIYCIWLGLLNESISFIRSEENLSTAVNTNIYVLLESLLFTWQFRNWKMFQKSKFIFPLLLFLLIAVWFIENFILFSIDSITSYFRIFYSFLLVLMSVNIINRLIVTDKRNILKNPVFLICMGFIIFYTYKILVETFGLSNFHVSRDFLYNVYYILVFINLFANLIYALAILWMPAKQRFSMPS